MKSESVVIADQQAAVNTFSGNIPNNNNSCDKPETWRQKAIAICQRNAMVTITPDKSKVDILLPNDDPKSTTIDRKKAEQYLLCSKASPVFSPPGGSIMVTLIDSSKKPIPNAQITWKSKYSYLTTSSSVTNEKGVAYANISIPYDIGTKSTFNVVAYYNYGNTSTTVTPSPYVDVSTYVSCTTTVYFSSPAAITPSL